MPDHEVGLRNIQEKETILLSHLENICDHLLRLLLINL